MVPPTAEAPMAVARAMAWINLAFMVGLPDGEPAGKRRRRRTRGLAAQGGGGSSVARVDGKLPAAHDAPADDEHQAAPQQADAEEALRHRVPRDQPALDQQLGGPDLAEGLEQE